MTSDTGAEPRPRATASTRGLALVATAAVLWALIGLFTPALIDEGLSAVDVAFWRAVVGGALFVLHRTVRRGSTSVTGRREATELLAFGAVAVGLFYVALAQAIDLGGVSLAFILLYTAPAWVAVGAVVLLREHLDGVRRLLVLITVVGAAMVAVGGGDGMRVGAVAVAWGLVAGLSYASWYLAGKRFLDRYDPVTISAWTLLAGAVVMAPFARSVPSSPRAWLLVAGLGVLSTYLAVLAYYSGLRHADASRAAIVATIEPVVALGIAVGVEGERLSAVALVGAVLVLAAAATASARA